MRIWFVDAFADRVFAGNTAAVVPLERWPADAALQAIAAQNRCSETAFIVPTELKGNYQLRWFTPATEAPICGHATLAAGAVVLTEIEPDLAVVVFDTLAGPLVVRQAGEGYTLDLPRRVRVPWTPPQELIDALGPAVVAEDAFAGEYATIVLDSEQDVRHLRPDIRAIDKLVRGPRQGCLAVTALADPGQGFHFVSRFFAPGVGLPEDPVTGSSFADLVPYWCDRLDLDTVIGFQASRRGGFVRGKQTLHSARLTGLVAVYMRGELAAELAPQLGFAPKAAEIAPPDAAPVQPRSEDDLIVRVAPDEADAEEDVLVYDLESARTDADEGIVRVAEPSGRAPDAAPANDISAAFPGGLAQR